MGAHAQNWSIVQDRLGLIYVGNTAGIFQFDGQQWTRIPMPRPCPVRALALGPDGTLYWGGVRDFGQLTPAEEGPVRALSLFDAVPEAQRDFTDIIQVLSARDGIYFLAHARTLRLHEGRITSLPGRAPRTQACVLEGTLCYVAPGRGLGRVEGGTHHPFGPPGLLPSALAPLGPGRLLVQEGPGGRLRSLDLRLPSRGTPRALQTFSSEVEGRLGADQASLYRLEPLSGDRMALLTLRAGLLVLDRQGRVVQAFNRKEGLIDDTVTGILEDRRGNLWVATNAGLTCLALASGQTRYDSRHGLEGGALSVTRHQGRLFVGTFSGLYQLARGPRPLDQPLARFQALPGGPREAWQFLEVEGDLLAGTAQGLARLAGDRAHSIPGATALPVLCLGTSRRWRGHLFAGLQGGLEVYRRQGGTWVSRGLIPGIRENLRRLTEDPQGDLWITTDTQGLLQVHFRGDDPLQVEVVRHGTASGLPEPRAFSVRAVGDTLYALTRQGVHAATPAPWREGPPPPLRFQPCPQITRALGDPALEVTDLEPHPQGGFLLNTSRGIARLRPTDTGYQVDFRAFRGGPQSHWRMVADPDGTLWLPDRALHRVEAGGPAPPVPFPVLLRHVEVAGQTSPLLGRPTSERTPAWPSHTHRLQFRVAAPWFEHPEATQFQFLLEGLDPTWSDWAASPVREYTRMPPGTYRFRARARNVFGDLGEEATFAFRILPPWYRTPAALALWILTAGGGLLGGVHLITLRLRRQKARLARLVDQRTEELQRVNERLYHLNDEKNRIIGMAAHDLRSPLSGILMACDLLEDPDPGETPALAARIRKEGTQMVALLQELLDVHAIDAGTAEQPVLGPVAPGTVVEAAVRAHRERALRKGITLEVDLGPPSAPLLADPRHLERVLENLVSNAVKYSPAGRRVLLSLRREPTHGTLAVADQGPGLTPEDHARLFQTYARLSARPTAGEATVGLGLSIVKKLVEGMGGTVWAEGSPGLGSTFLVRLPWAPLSPPPPG